MMEKKEVKPQKVLFDSGNELAAYAAKQINYHVMGYYPMRGSGIQCDQRQWSFVRPGTASGPVGYPVSDGDECGLPDGLRAAFD